MFNGIKQWWRRRKEPKVWAIRGLDTGCRWLKVVTTKPPRADMFTTMIGPFRSELDCEEFCDKGNSLSRPSYTNAWKD